LQFVNGFPCKGKTLQQLLIVSLHMKCVFTEVNINSDIHCLAGWATYVHQLMDVLCVVRN